MAEHCEFGTQLKEQLRDQVVSRIISVAVRTQKKLDREG